MGAAGEIWNRQFSHAEEFVQNIRGSLLTKDGLCKFLHRADALEPAETLLLRLLPAAWLNRLNTLRTPEARQKGRFVTLACKKLSFCLAYEVKPRNRQFSHAQENIRIVQTSYKIMFFNVYHCLFHFYP